MDTPVIKTVAEDKKTIEELLRDEGRKARWAPHFFARIV
jgi:hypothetical protein